MTEPFFHALAVVETREVGAGTRVWAFAHVLPGAVIGRDCNICDHVFIENDVHIGDRVTVKCGVQLWDGTRIADDVFIGPNATFTNDPMPRSKQHLAKYPITRVERGASIGANATILPGITISTNAMVGAGAVVTRDVPPHAVVVGNPARIVRYADTLPHARSPNAERSPLSTVDTAVREVQLVRVPIVEDMRGNLMAREFGRGLPFVPQRYFVVFDVPSKEVRGAHAHRLCQQFLVCLRGSVAVVCDDGTHKQETLLDSPELGLYLPPMVWGVQYQYTADAMLLVLASHGYDAADYIRDYAEFLKERASYERDVAARSNP
jgi:UDP-2-acetamido-3-amino-2,3-dideoxy-glucuronate N-acetyltransferase